MPAGTQPKQLGRGVTLFEMGKTGTDKLGEFAVPVRQPRDSARGQLKASSGRTRSKTGTERCQHGDHMKPPKEQELDRDGRSCSLNS